ncbi:MAG TPA: quinone-dependent dihydroorotate dehydrogenase, partial [Puia sp.]|nr:quinone-dependent dihydroorotate dehydrogenase [Puia sp.]
LAREVLGLSFRNPVGLGAGFDKNALYLRELDALGFGFVEIGTVTPLPQSGNDRPRLFRLRQDQALVNRMGFNNDGVKVIAGRLREWRDREDRRQGEMPLLIGGNIGKNKVTPNEEAWKDYDICMRELFGLVDYFVVNVSSPNTPGLRELQEKEALRRILVNLQGINRELSEARSVRAVPVLLKISPDLTRQQTDDVISLALEIKLDGLVAANTTISREGLISSPATLESIGAGGVSGAPLKERSTALIRYIQGKTMGSIPLIASGGIFTGEDAKEKINAGASLVQVWTGFIYEGPFITLRICRELAAPVPK